MDSYSVEVSQREDGAVVTEIQTEYTSYALVMGEAEIDNLISQLFDAAGYNPEDVFVKGFGHSDIEYEAVCSECDFSSVWDSPTSASNSAKSHTTGTGHVTDYVKLVNGDRVIENNVPEEGSGQ